MSKWKVFYRIENGVYEPKRSGKTPVPTENYDKVIQVPEEIAMQILKFDFDGEKLTRKEGHRILTLEELHEKYNQENVNQLPSDNESVSNDDIEIIL
ncbi:hypothetical protein [Salinicoccus carnicancri]|uniref:hypothetical protein n=1 Tax=Salinicoccus carnicancri TaxID=558170 RepID=UPI00031E5E87|nr:hypothetical protein [Salinicoccus carnicancri]